MTEPIVFPDVETLLVRVLPDLVGVDVSTRVPDPRPDSFVRLKRVGGTAPNRITDSALVVVECWAADEIAAAYLARATRAHVHALAQTDHDGDYVRRVREVAGPQAFPDPSTEHPRYQFTVQIDTRGVPL